jgi:hypothetical protein
VGMYHVDEVHLHVAEQKDFEHPKHQQQKVEAAKHQKLDHRTRLGRYLVLQRGKNRETTTGITTTTTKKMQRNAYRAKKSIADRNSGEERAITGLPGCRSLSGRIAECTPQPSSAPTRRAARCRQTSTAKGGKEVVRTARNQGHMSWNHRGSKAENSRLRESQPG